MDLVDTLFVVRYCFTIMTHLPNLQVKVMDFEIMLSCFRLKFLDKVFTSLLYPLNFYTDLVDSLLHVRSWFEVLCFTNMSCLCYLQVKAIVFKI